jgi:hypothetical protein
MIIDELVEGETDPRIWQLTETSVAGVTSNLDGTGLTLSDVILTGADGEPVDTSGKFSWNSQAGGTVKYAQDAADFKALKSRYTVRVKLTDGNGKIRFYPNKGSIAESSSRRCANKARLKPMKPSAERRPVRHVKDLTPDPANRRQHNPRNVGMIVDALHKVGAGRSIVIDEKNVVLAGNATIDAAAEARITKVQVVEAESNNYHCAAPSRAELTWLLVLGGCHLLRTGRRLNDVRVGSSRVLFDRGRRNETPRSNVSRLTAERNDRRRENLQVQPE